MRLTPHSLIFILCILSAYHNCRSQSSSPHMGARTHSLGNIVTTTSDVWSAANNIGGLAHIKEVTAAFSYLAVPSFKPFNKMSAVVSVPFTVGVAGLSVYKFGDDLYNEQILSAGFSSKFGIASIGIKANYLQYYVEGFGNKGVATVSLGGVTNLTPHLSVGAYVINLNQPLLSEYEHVPTVMMLGIGLKVTESIQLFSEIEKDLDKEAIIKAGLEYKALQKVSFRTGFNMKPQSVFLGFGFFHKKFLLDYSFQYMEALGSSHQATVGYKISRP